MLYSSPVPVAPAVRFVSWAFCVRITCPTLEFNGEMQAGDWIEQIGVPRCFFSGHGQLEFIGCGASIVANDLN